MVYTNQTKSRDFLSIVKHSTIVNKLSNDCVLTITVVNRESESPSIVLTGPQFMVAGLMASNFATVMDPDGEDTLVHCPLILPISDTRVDSFPQETLSAVCADVMNLENYTYVSPFMREQPPFWPASIPFKPISTQSDRVSKWRKILKAHQQFVYERVSMLCGEDFALPWRRDSGEDVDEEEGEVDVQMRAMPLGDHNYQKAKSKTPSVQEIMEGAVDSKDTRREIVQEKGRGKRGKRNDVMSIDGEEETRRHRVSPEVILLKAIHSSTEALTHNIHTLKEKNTKVFGDVAIFDGVLYHLESMASAINERIEGTLDGIDEMGEMRDGQEEYIGGSGMEQEDGSRSEGVSLPPDDSGSGNGHGPRHLPRSAIVNELVGLDRMDRATAEPFPVERLEGREEDPIDEKREGGDGERRGKAMTARDDSDDDEASFSLSSFLGRKRHEEQEKRREEEKKREEMLESERRRKVKRKRV